MLIAFLFSKENTALAQAETEALLPKKGDGAEKGECVEKTLYVADVNEVNELQKRLAYTISIHALIETTTIEKLEQTLLRIDWKKEYDTSFCVRIHHLRTSSVNITEQQIAGPIWRALDNPCVDLQHPKTTFTIFIGKKVFICRKIGDVEKSYAQRLPKNRPVRHPSTLQPRLARAIVNLTGAQRGDLILDPFCGSGGILIEAGLMGLKTKGYDIHQKMILACTKNLTHCGVKRFHLEERDARLLDEKIDYVVTDVPYGRNTKTTGDLFLLLSVFLKKLKRYLQKRAVIIFPDFIDYTTLLRESGLQKKSEFSSYIHKTLTRKIIVVEP